MKIQNLLSIGSIVLLKNGEKKLMIIGIMQSDNGRKKRIMIIWVNFTRRGILEREFTSICLITRI